MARTVIFTFDDGNGTTYHTVYRDDSDPSIITQKLFEYASGETPYPTYTEGEQVGGSTCTGTTLNIYTFTEALPFAIYSHIYNSPICGFVPSCDIAIVSFSYTDETEAGANDGTANLFCSTSVAPVYYQLIGMGVGNSTGYFTGIPPGDYHIQASDGNECIINQFFTIHAFDSSRTHYKYRLQFEGINSGEIWECRLLDMYNSYDSSLFPTDVYGTEAPIISRQEDQNEDKTTAIISRNLEINLIYDGVTFITDEFTLSKERQWKIELYREGQLEFQGWLLPDEIQDLYDDPEYQFTLKCTDGLPSLKGNIFGDGSGIKDYSTSQIQQYGVTAWALLVKQCLDQLGYDYGTPKFLSSLQYNSTYNSDLWVNLGTWSDILYDTSGTATDTYSALELLLMGAKLTIFQHQGEFFFVNNNDLFYTGNALKLADYQFSFYELSADFESTIATGTAVQHPVVQYVGFDQPNIPINPQQSLNYDKAYNIKTKIDFNVLALLYENPSFEIGAVQGEVPNGFTTYGLISAYLNHDLTAYIGEWVLKTIGYVTFLREGGLDNPVLQEPGGFFFMHGTERAIFNNPEFIMDQPNKKVNLSFEWRPVYYSDDENVVPTVCIFFSTPTKLYMYSLEDKVNNSGWFELDDPFPFAFISQRITDYQAWNSITIITDVLPEGGIGNLKIGFRTPLRYDGAPILDVTTTDRQIDYDDFQVTLLDASEDYSLQIGEIHSVTAVTGVPQANNKEIDLKLFTYPPNKRIAGNIFTMPTYADGQIQNLWSFKLKSLDIPDRLPATITKATGRNYQRPMRIFEGDLQSNYLSFYSIFILRWYESSVFMPFSIQMDLRNGTAHVILIEISDDDQQSIYNYSPTYQKSARRVVSQ